MGAGDALRWLILTDDYPPGDGGIATWTAAVAAGLAAVGAEVVVFCRARHGLSGAPGVRVVPVSGPRFGAYGPAWVALAVRAELRPADRLLCTTWPMAGPWVGRHGAVDVVVHGSDLTRPDPRRAPVLRAATRVLAPSAFLAGLVAGEGARAVVLPAPIDAGPPAPRPVALRRVALVARATPFKGAERLFRVLARGGLEGVVVGAGPALPAWREAATVLGARVRFTGRLPRPAVRGVLARCQLAALLPHAGPKGAGAEGFGLALVEAAAAGVPGLGCATGGVPEALGPGLVVPDPDDVEAVWAALAAWWTPERGEEARLWVAERHGVAACVRALGGG